MIEKGYCQCGCGEKTRIIKYDRPRQGLKAGEPLRFIFGHQSREQNNPSWRGGKTKGSRNGRYSMTKVPGHPRANTYGYVLDHILLVERILGKPLAKGTEVHHFPSDDNWTNLVICQDELFHRFLHLRHKALQESGNKNYRKCQCCHQWDDLLNLHPTYKKDFAPAYYHVACKKKADHARWIKKNLSN